MADATSAETKAFNENVSRQRLDHFELPNGMVRAVLTVTVGEKEFVYQADSSAAEAAENARVEGDDAAAVEGFFGDLAHAAGKIGKGLVKGVKAVASSKVFKIAAKGLAVIAPALGPLAPAALTVSGAMQVTSKLVGARHAADRGNPKAAAALTAEAVKLAKVHAPRQSAALLKIAADKSRGAYKVAAIVRPKATAKPAPTKSTTRATSSAPRTSLPALGSGSALSSAALLAAARAGRVYVVHAA